MSRPPLDDKNNKEGLVDLGPIPGFAPVASFNIDGIENLLQTKSFVALHYRHALNPDRESLNGPVDPNTQAAHRGVQYYSVRPLGIVPQQFKIEDRLTAQGLWGVGSVLINVTGQYLDEGVDKKTHIRPRDLIYMPTLTDITEQLFEYNPTGPQRLNYQIKGVDYLVDGERNIYQEGRDFIIKNGMLEWTKDGLKPKFKNGKGDILTCVYYYSPLYVVVNLPHSLRVIPSNEFGHAALPREATYAPQLVVAKPSTVMQEEGLLNPLDLPPFPQYPDSKNTTGGSR